MISSKSQELFESQAINPMLKSIYSNVPSGTCSGSTNCCSESVNTFYSEFIALVNQLESEGNLEEFTKRALNYYLTELVIPMKCPMLQENGLCVLYASRPLPCRVFGNLSREEYEENYSEVLEENIEAVEHLREEFCIEVPESVSHQKVEFCTNFRSDTGFTLEDRDDLVDDLFMLDSKFLSSGELNPEYFSLSMVQWFAYAVWGDEKAQELRIKVSQEITECGESVTLKDTLDTFSL